MTAERTIETRTHGRYLVDSATAAPGSPLIVGFHGYAEEASIQMERLQAVRGPLAATLVSVQALHRFYRRDGRSIAAGWMTREDRELMIADNIAYVDAVIDQVGREFAAASTLVLTGFSQGASMAYRAATLGRHAAAGVIAVGGDIPPEIAGESLRGVNRSLIGWGLRDPFFTREIRDRDERRLREAGLDVSVIEIDAAHEWTHGFSEAAREWLRALA